MKKRRKLQSAALLLLPLSFMSCQEGNGPDKELATTHKELSEDLAKDSLTVPYSDSTSRQLYNRYRITTEQYLNSGTFSVGNMYGGKLAPLDEASHADARTYRSVLRQGMKKGINFAGKYTVVSIGCGTGCQQHYVVDRETGKVLDKLQGSLGARYSADSRLFILNPPDSAVNYQECRNCTPVTYEFRNGEFRKVAQEKQ